MNHNESIRTITPPCVARDAYLCVARGRKRGRIPPSPLVFHGASRLRPHGGNARDPYPI